MNVYMVVIFIVEDDAFIRDGLKRVFIKEGYRVVFCENLRLARDKLKTESPDLMVLDVILTDGNGFDFCKEVRSSHSFPILFLTCCNEEYDVVNGLDVGGDDYVTKPFRVQELLSRTKALLRRSGMNGIPNVVIRCGNVTLDLERQLVHMDGERIDLTPNEFHLLHVLMKNQGIVVSRQKILQNVWDIDGDFIEDNTLSVYISGVRKKLAMTCIKIETVRSVGYRLVYEQI